MTNFTMFVTAILRKMSLDTENRLIAMPESGRSLITLPIFKMKVNYANSLLGKLLSLSQKNRRTFKNWFT